MIPLALLLATSAVPVSVEDTTPAQPLRLGAVTTSAFGVTHARFFNQLLGVRLERRFTPRFAFGAALSYANLKGKDERVHNVLPEVTTEYRLPTESALIGLPVHVSCGFLPRNGPTLRLSAGLEIALHRSLSLELIPLEPMVWVTRERPEVSLNGTISIRLAL